MSLFFDYKCEVRGSDRKNAVVCCTAWCKSEPTLAVATENGEINFFQDEGVRLDRAVICRSEPGMKAMQMDWQPRTKVLAVGWKDGSVNSYTLQEGGSSGTFQNKLVHREKLRFLKWNPAGTRLITGDAAGTVCVWKSDSRGSLSASQQYRKGLPLTTMVFCFNMLAGRSDVLQQAFSPSFFFGTENGAVCYADDLGHCTDVNQLSSSVDTMMYYEEKQRLVIVTRSLLMTQLQVGDDGRVVPVMKVKLSVAGDASDRGVREVCWAGPGLLCSATSEKHIRFWDLANDENYVLNITGGAINTSDRATCVAFNPLQRYLAVGTMEGKVVMWKFEGEYNSGGGTSISRSKVQTLSTSSADWKQLPHSSMDQGKITSLVWGPGHGLLGVGTNEGATLLSETVLNRTLNAGVAVLQTGTYNLMVEYSNGASFPVRTNLKIKGVAVDEDFLVIWNGKECSVYKLNDSGGSQQYGSAILVETFPSEATTMVLKSGIDGRDGAIFQAVGKKLEQVNFSGTPLNSITFSETEGKPVLLDINGFFLAVATDKGVIKLYDTKRERKEPKQLGSSGRFIDSQTQKRLGAMRSIRCNADGTRLSILSDHVHGGSLNIREPDTRLHVYDADGDIVIHYDFQAQRRFPVTHFWDPAEPKLLACETHRLKIMDSTKNKVSKVVTAKASKAEAKSAEEKKSESKTGVDINTLQQMRSKLLVDSGELDAEVEVTTLFVTADYGILMQDVFPLEAPLDSLIGITVPKLYFISKDPGDDSKEALEPNLLSRVMRDFVGLENVDTETRAALMDFSYFLTVGNMDEAYRAVKLIRNPSVWENMAHMCVKTKRLDVAEVCLGNMGHARGAAAVRMAKQEPELEACIAAVAIQLGLLDDAVRLYKECGREDLLTELYQGAGLWDKAVETAEQADRIHLKTVHHQYAKHLEEIGDTAGAIQHYELADTYQTEVPRMLFEKRRMDDLEHYITQGKDPKLLKWWAGYLESKGVLDKAKKFYMSAKDYLSLVRIACYKQDFEEAKRIVQKSNDKSASYHLARQYEGLGEFQEAVSYYAHSGRFNHAIRIAKAYGMDLELMNFALKSKPAQMVDVAQYFEMKEEYEKAVQLYQKGGDIPKALDLCFKAGSTGRKGMFEILKNIAEDLGEDTSPQVLARCAEFFIEHKQFEKAVRLYITGKRYHQAIELCMQNKVKINEDMAEGLTPEKGDQDRNDVLNNLARVCKKQGSFHLACKKYTQAGERLKALKCLLKSGDTKNIIYYANVSRNREIYILAANYLQSLDWHNEANVMKSIITFYTKAKAYEQLANFYDACAQVEIDEYRDYEKAVGALNEAVKHMVKSKGANKDEQLASLHQRINLVEQFVKARQMAKTDPAEMVGMCTELLREPEIEGAIRVGDCFALLVEYHYSQQNLQEAYDLIQQMKQRKIVLNPYIEKEMINEIYNSVGHTDANDSEIDDDIEDEIGEGLDESVDDESDDEGKFGGK